MPKGNGKYRTVSLISAPGKVYGVHGKILGSEGDGIQFDF